VPRVLFVYFLGHNPHDSLVGIFLGACTLTRTLIFLILYMDFYVFLCVYGLHLFYQCIYMCVCVIFFICVQNDNIIHD
jgi:hypothetical protein